MVSDRNENKETPLSVLILMSLAMPGTAQLALGQKVKGSLFIGIAAILFIAFMYKGMLFLAPAIGYIAAGKPPPLSNEFLVQIKTLFAIIGAIVLFNGAVAIDAMITGQRKK